MDQYRATAVYLREHVWVLVGVFAITVFQRFALFAATWFVYKAFGLSGSSAFVIIILQGTISVAVDMLPLPGGMGISEQLFLRIFLPIFGNKLLLPGIALKPWPGILHRAALKCTAYNFCEFYNRKKC